MKVIIIGAGDVGFVAAETISSVHDVLIIEKDFEVAEQVKSRLNVSVLHGDGTNPRILEYAIEDHGADIVIACLRKDDSNLFACMLSKKLKPDIKTVSTITNPDYMTDSATDGVDFVISPEILTAEKMYKLAILENAIDYEIANGADAHVAIFAVESDQEIVGKIVMNLDVGDEATVFGVYRNDQLLVNIDTMEIHVGDRLCVFGSENGLMHFNEIMGVDSKAREFIILGGSIVGMNLARLLSTDSRRRFVKIIDRNPQRCRELAKNLSGVVVINADFSEPETQNSENIFKADCTMSTSRQDDTNLLMCMSAQNFHARKIVSRYVKKEYEDIFKFTGLDTIGGFHHVVSNEITKCTLPDEVMMMRLRANNEIFFTHKVDKDSKLNDSYLGDLNIPEGIRVVAVEREDKLIYPRLDFKFKVDDSVIVFTYLDDDDELVKVFGKDVVPEL